MEDSKKRWTPPYKYTNCFPYYTGGCGDEFLYLSFSDWLEEQGSFWSGYIRIATVEGNHEYPLSAGIVAVTGIEPYRLRNKKVELTCIEVNDILSSLSSCEHTKPYLYIENNLKKCIVE